MSPGTLPALRPAVPAANANDPVRLPWRIAIRLVLLLAMVSTAVVCWYYVRAERWDTPPLIPVLALSELPLVVSLILVARKNFQAPAAIGAGLALGTGIFSIALAALFEVDAGLGIWDTRGTYRNLVSFQKVLPAALLIGVLLVIFSWLPGKKSRSRFFAGFAIFVVYFFVAIATLARCVLPGTGSKKETNAWVAAPEQARRAVVSLAACLIQQQAAHPDEGFPSSLAQVRPDWQCDPQYLKPAPAANYEFSYTPQIDPITRRAVDFRVTAIPFSREFKPYLMNPLMADSRGVLFQVRGWSTGPNSPTAIEGGADLGESRLLLLRTVAETYTKEHAGRGPATFHDFLDAQANYSWGYIEGNGTSLRSTSNAYTNHSFAPRPDDLGRFSISATCQIYGKGCIRSYLLDYDGVIHGTPQARAATPQDPAVLPCEIDYRQCDDIDWFPYSNPTPTQVFIAAVQHGLSTTALWFPPKEGPGTPAKESFADRYARFGKAHSAVWSVTACLIRGAQLHPKAGFPASLQSIAPDWNCDQRYTGSNLVAGYRLDYEIRKGSSSAVADDFRLSAVPQGERKYPGDPLLTDRRGIIFTFGGWSSFPGVVPSINTMSEISASRVLILKYALDDYMKKNGAAPPATLSALVDRPMGIQRAEIADATATLLNENVYVVRYLPPSSAHPNMFAISAVCRKYGEGCIRSYFLDFDGTIHGTGEPRPATPADPPVTRCETYGSDCQRDTDWIMPE